MKIKQILSAILAGAVTLTSSYVTQLPMAAMAEEYDLPMLTSEGTDTIDVPIFENRATESGEPIDINLCEYGILTPETVVEVTCTVDTTDIKDENNETPQWAFGIVVNNNWEHDTMPHCDYDSAQTTFTMELTEGTLQMNPRFTIQQQLPCASKMTVKVKNLQKDERSELQLSPISSSFVMYSYADSSWLDGYLCGNNVPVGFEVPEGMTIGDLRSTYRRIDTTENPFYADSLGIGAQHYGYKVEVEYTDDNGASATVGGDVFDYTEAGITYMDLLLPDDSLDSFEINSITLYVSAKTTYDSALEKETATSPKVHDLLLFQNVYIEIAEDTRPDLVLPENTKSSVVVTKGTDDGGDYVEAEIPLDMGELAGITLGDFLTNYHTVTFPAPGYYSNSVNADPDDFSYNVLFMFENESGYSCRHIGSTYEHLDTDSKLYTFRGMGNDFGKDFTLKGITLYIGAVYEDDPENDSIRIKSEILHNLERDTEFLIEFSEDTRAEETVTVPTAPVKMDVWQYVQNEEEWWSYKTGMDCGGTTSALTIPGVTYGETTFGQYAENIKSLTATLPYYYDSIEAGKDAFQYRLIFAYDGGEVSNYSYRDFDETLTVYTDTLDLNGLSDTVIDSIYLQIEAKFNYDDNIGYAVAAAAINALNEGDAFYIEPVEDTRDSFNVKMPYPPAVDMWAFKDEQYFDGSFVSESIIGDIGALKGLTADELKERCKSVTVDSPGYVSDTLDLGEDAYVYELVLSFYDSANDTYMDVTAQQAALYDDFELPTILLDCNQLNGYVLDGAYVNICAAYNITEDGRKKAVSDTISGMSEGDKVTVELYVRAELTLPEPGGIVKMTAYDDSGFSGACSWGYSDPIKTNGISYGYTTLGDFIRNYQKVICNTVPYFTNSLGVDREAFNCQLVLKIDEDLVYELGPAVTLGDSIICDIEYDTDIIDIFGDYKIHGAYLYIEPKYETTDNDLLTASDETLRNLENGTEYYIYLSEVKPENVKAVAGDGEVTLTWDAVDGAASYVIKDGGTTVLAGCVTGTTCTFPGLDNGVKYTYTVYAVLGSGGNSAASDTVSATPKADIVPKKVKLVAVDGNATLTWNRVAGAEMYMIKDGGTTILADCITDTTYTFTDVEDGTTCTYTVFAYVNGEWSDASEPVSAVMFSREALVIPAPGGIVKMTAWTNPYLEGAGSSGYSAPIEIDGVVYGETTFGDFIRRYNKIVCSSVPYFTNSLGVDRNAFECQMVVKMVDPDTYGDERIYYVDPTVTLGDAIDGDVEFDSVIISFLGDYKVTGVCLRIVSKIVQGDSGRVTMDETLRNLEEGAEYYIYLSEVKPENVKAVAGVGSVTLTWDAVDGAEMYLIKDGGTTILADCITDTTYTFTGLDSGINYTYSVYAVLGSGGNSAASDTVSATPKADIVPKNVKAAAGSGKVTLTWDEVEGATAYTIKDGGSTVLAKSIKDTTYTFTGLENGKTYTYTVYAYAGGKWSTASAKVTATPTIVPQNVKAEEGDFEITVTWDEVEGATAYTIKDGGSTVLAKSVKDTTYTFTELEGGKTYTYTVFAYVNGKWSTASEPVSAVPRARGDLILPEPGGMVEMTAYDHNGYSGAYSYGYSEPIEVDGIVYGETTYGDLVRNYKSIILNSVPYFTNSLGVDREAFEYKIELEVEDGFVKYFGSAVTLGDASVCDIRYDRSEIDFWGNYKIVGIKLLITPKFETTEDGSLTASDETLRSLGNSTEYYIYLSEVKPENVKAVAGDGEVTITWDLVDSALGYVIRDGDSNLIADGINEYTNYCTIFGLTNFKTYTYTVYAILDYVFSAASDPVSATPTGNTIPQNVKVVAVDGNATLTWDAVNGATAYTIKDGGSTVLAKSIKDTTYTFTGIEDGTTCTYTVYAYAGGKWSTASEPVSAVMYTRGDLILPEPGGMVTMTAAYKNGYSGTYSFGYSDTLEVDGIVYGETTVGDFFRSYRKVICNTVPYFTNSLGVDREAFECSIILNLETGYSLEYNSAFTLGDSIIYYNGYDQSFIDRFGNNKIVGIKLRITPKVETTEDGSLTASDETLRSLSNGTNYYIYLSEVKPENVIAIAGDGWVGVVWNSIPGATEYVIMDGDSNVVAEGLNPFVNYYTITGLTNFKTYTYTVQARLGDGGWSAASDPVSATPTGNTIPQNVKATAGDGEVTLTWDAVNGATTYVIKDGGSTVLAKGIKDTTYTFTGLENGTTYTFAVYAYAGGKWNGSSAKVTATPKASYIPKNVKATAGDGEVTLTWDAVNGATTYVIKDGGTTVLAKNIKDTTYTITGLENGTTYTFTVYAYANGKWNGASAKVTATPKANYIPQNVRVRSAANGKVILVWDEVAGATAYVIKDGGTTILAKNIKDTTYSFTGLENGTTYTYTVYAYANGKWNGASEKVTATPIATIVPQNVEATVGDGEITLTWDEIEGATAYVIKDGGTTILAKNIKDTTYTFTGLENGTTYTYTVFAYANGKWSAASEKITATPEA